MINKKSIWFLTLFSLILVLSVYYITMPTELLINAPNDETEIVTSVEENSILVALRVESDEQMLKDIENLQAILTNENSSLEEKNNAFDNMKALNAKRGEEEKLETKIKETYQLNSFIKIKDNAIEVIINSKEHSTEIANNIIRTIQENYQNKMYITVKFTN